MKMTKLMLEAFETDPRSTRKGAKKDLCEE
jgi:hypothetical protein